MKLPRDLSGQEFAGLLRKFGYQITRQTGSHIRLSSTRKGPKHPVTVPAHRALSVGTLAAILGEVTSCLEMERGELTKELFGS